MTLLDPVIRHQDMADKIAEMSETELNVYKTILNKVGGKAMFDLQLERRIVREDNCSKLG